MDIFETASRKKFRFDSPVGLLNTEQLWDLPLVHATKVNLDAVARAVNAELKGVTEESFVRVVPDSRQSELETKLEIVKHVISVKIKAIDEAKSAADRRAKRSQLLDALAAKESQELSAASKDDILKQLAELDG